MVSPPSLNTLSILTLLSRRFSTFDSSNATPPLRSLDRYVTQIYVYRSRATLSVSPPHPNLTELSLIMLSPALELDPILLPLFFRSSRPITHPTFTDNTPDCDKPF